MRVQRTMVQRPWTKQRPAAPSHIDALSIGADLLTIFIGLSASFSVHLVGTLYVSEVALLFLWPILLFFRARRLQRSRLLTCFGLLALWLVNQVVTDIYRSTPARDWMRGDAAILFFAVDIVALAILLAGNDRRKVFFIASFAIGSLLAARYQPLPIMEGDEWKFGYSSGVHLLVVLLCCYFFKSRKYVPIIFLLLGMMSFNLFMNYRSSVLFFLVTLVLVVPIVPERFGNLRVLPRVGSVSRIAVLAGLAVIAGLMALSAVNFATASGMLGEDAKAKNEMQMRARGGILLGGRPEIFVSSRAVYDSPILGHGSWARDFRYTEMLSDIQARWGNTTDLEDIEAQSLGLIPAHSHLMGAWVWAGIFGAVFWAYILWFTFKALFRVLNTLPPLAPVYVWMFVDYVWAILFSPFGSTDRTLEALKIVVIIDLVGQGVKFARSRASRRRWRRLGPQHLPPRTRTV